MADPDWNDPCAVATWLKPQLHAVAAGTSIVDIRDGDRRIAYSQGNYPALLALYNESVTACARKNGSRTGRRRAFIAR